MITSWDCSSLSSLNVLHWLPRCFQTGCPLIRSETWRYSPPHLKVPAGKCEFPWMSWPSKCGRGWLLPGVGRKRWEEITSRYPVLPAGDCNNSQKDLSKSLTENYANNAMRHTESLAEKSGKFAPLLASWTQDMEAEGLRSDHDRWVLPSQLVRRQPRENFGDPKKDGRMVQKFYTRDVQKKKKKTS